MHMNACTPVPPIPAHERAVKKHGGQRKNHIAVGIGVRDNISYEIYYMAYIGTYVCL